MAKAVSDIGGHKIGHIEETANDRETERDAVETANNEVSWCARRDSNSRPNAPEAFALSS